MTVVRTLRVRVDGVRLPAARQKLTFGILREIENLNFLVEKFLFS